MRRDQAGENDRSHLIEDHMSDDDGIYWQCQGMDGQVRGGEGKGEVHFVKLKSTS